MEEIDDKRLSSVVHFIFISQLHTASVATKRFEEVLVDNNSPLVSYTKISDWCSALFGTIDIVITYARMFGTDSLEP